MKHMFSLFLCAALLAVPCRAERVPILMYHDVSERGGGEFAVSLTRFDEHLTALEAAGYHTVTFADLIGYVYFGGCLPERPVLLTSDDGYTNVVECAASCAARHGMGLSCAVIGSLAGQSGHFPLTCVPDNVELVSHTYALHDRPGWNGAVCGDSGLPSYEQILTEDCEAMRETCGEAFPLTGSVLIYPHGSHSAESERIFRSLGCIVTVTCGSGIAEIRRGDPESLHLLPRISVWRDTTAEEVIAEIEAHENRS